MKTSVVLFAVLALLPTSIFASDEAHVIPLWQNGALGFENRHNEPEQAASYWVKNGHNPSIIVLRPPKEKATGAVVIVCPGVCFWNVKDKQPVSGIDSKALMKFNGSVP